jgi:acetylornithine deacetylase
VVRNGKLYGRGSFDMKGALAASFVLLKILSDKNVLSEGDVIVESVVDEENGGSNGTLACRLRGYDGDAAILPEPSLLSICPACKGGKTYRIDIQGRAGTGFAGEEIVNPIYGLGALLRGIRDYEIMINENPRSAGRFYSSVQNPRTVTLDKAHAGDLEPGGNVGVPDSAWFSVYINTLPGFSEKDLDTELTRYLLERVRKDSALFPQEPTIRGISRYLYPFETDPSHPIIPLLETGVASFSDSGAVVEGADFACDGFIFHRFFNIPTIIFGPRGGNAHAQDEFVFIDDLVFFTKVCLYTVMKWCGVVKELS